MKYIKEQTAWLDNRKQSWDNSLSKEEITEYTRKNK